MSGILGCIGTWMPIPGQLFECGMAIINNVIPGIMDAWGAIAKFLTSIMDAAMAVGK